LWNDRGIASCIDGATGKIHWRQRIGGNYFSSPVRVADRIYGVSVDGEVVCLSASQEFQELGRSALGETIRATPAVAGGRMFLRTESHLLAVGQP
jgi:outer membrane protein assembly factor BamB